MNSIEAFTWSEGNGIKKQNQNQKNWIRTRMQLIASEVFNVEEIEWNWFFERWVELLAMLNWFFEDTETISTPNFIKNKKEKEITVLTTQSNWSNLERQNKKFNHFLFSFLFKHAFSQGSFCSTHSHFKYWGSCWEHFLKQLLKNNFKNFF